MSHSRTAARLRRLALLGALLLPALAGAQEPEPISRTLPTLTTLSMERVTLPGGERLGLVGSSLLFAVNDSLAVGPAVYGAATGERGGLFVGGVELQHRLRLGRSLGLATSLHAGGGGGGAAPVGGGLMLRPAATLFYELGPTLHAGLSWAMVKFPSGQIDSRQFGLVLAWQDRFRYYEPESEGRTAVSPRDSGLGFDRIAATAGTYRLSDGSGRSIGLAGARADRRSGIRNLTLSMEAAGAAGGDAAGYMEILAGAGWSVEPSAHTFPGLRLGLRGALGLGGGGAVPTGGGTLAKATATLELALAKGWTIGVEGGVVRGLNGTLRAKHAQVWAGAELEPAFDGRVERHGPVVRSEWTGALQHHARVERKDGSVGPLDTIGLKLSRYLTPHVYLAGQAHSAFAGGAGAYSVGLLGVGVATRAHEGARLGAEALIGAAGGGRVATSGGAIAQAMLWAGWATASAGEWRIGAGTVRGVRGASMRSPSLELSWTKAFGFAGR